MMKILLIKLSSLGDVVHTFPAVTDLLREYPNCQVDWAVEPAYESLVRLHPGINQIIPVSTRGLKQYKYSEFIKQIKNLRQQKYDYIIDAQGLLKSLLVARLARGKIHGPSWRSARDKWATLGYQHTYDIPRREEAHPVERMRTLFSAIFNYEYEAADKVEYGIKNNLNTSFDKNNTDYLVFLHGTTWQTKKWPIEHWRALARKTNMPIKILWGDEKEKMVANTIAQEIPHVQVMPKLSITQVYELIAGSKAMVGLDTGFAHLAAAYNIPMVSLYGATGAKLVGALGDNQIHLQSEESCSPCLKKQCTHPDYTHGFVPCLMNITPERVWEKLTRLI